MRFEQRVLLVALFLSAILILGSLGGSKALSAPATEPTKLPNVKMPKFLTIKGMGAPGGSAEMMSKPFIKNIEKCFPEIKIREIPGGTRDGVDRIESGECQVGVTNMAWPYWAWFAMKTGKYHHRVRSARTLYCVYTGYVLSWVVLADSDIYGFKDFYNKRICPGKSTYGYVPGIQNMFAKVHNLTWDKIKKNGGLVYWGSPTDAMDMIAEGRLDAAPIVGPNPWGPVQKLAMSKKLRLVPMTPEEQAAICDPVWGTVGYTPGIIPAGTYKWQKEDIPGVTSIQLMIAAASLPEDVVYNLMWANFCEGRGRLMGEMFPTYADPSIRLPEHALDMISIPLHPGAERFWKDWRYKIPKPLCETNPPPPEMCNE